MAPASVPAAVCVVGPASDFVARVAAGARVMAPASVPAAAVRVPAGRASGFGARIAALVAAVGKAVRA